MAKNVRPTHPPLLTRAEAAARFGVDVHTVARWTRQGKLAAVRTPGGLPRYEADTIDELLANPIQSVKETGPTEPPPVCQPRPAS